MFTATIIRKFVTRTMALLAFAVLSQGLSARVNGQPETKTPPKTITLNSLSMEVNALQALHQLRLDKAQLEKIMKWAEESAAKDQQRKPAKASAEFREKLTALRKALQEAKDGELIGKLSDEVDALQEKEKPTIDDRVEATETARKRAAEAYRVLKAGQAAAYLGQIADSVRDPIEQLRDAVEEVRAMNEEDWKDARGEIADAISRSVVGLDEARVKRMSPQIAALLTKARSLSKAEFQKQASDLETAAQKLIGDISPEVVLRHQLELDLASLLSNPRTPQACRALIKAHGAAQTGKK